MTRQSKTLLVFTLLATSILFGGCVASINKHPPHRIGTTLGQELIDLDKAREAGSLSEDEYGVQRARLLGEIDSN